MDEKTLSWIRTFGWMTIILFLGFELGFLCSKSFIDVEMNNYFYNGSIPDSFKFGLDNATLSKMADPIPQSDYCTYDYNYSLCTEKPILKSSGLYRNGKKE